jgi:hypothetical protein
MTGAARSTLSRCAAPAWPQGVSVPMISFGEAKAARRSRKKVTAHALRIRFTLRDSDPPIWRCLLVHDSMTLMRLHDALQIAFNWFDYQTHRFVVRDTAYGNPVRRKQQTEVEDDRDFTLADLALTAGETFVYEYHFGDGWHVDALVEAVVPARPRMRRATLLNGERNGPPEDCGGPDGLKEILFSLAHPAEPLSQEWIEWLGGEWDPTAFDPGAINRALTKLAKE